MSHKKNSALILLVITLITILFASFNNFGTTFRSVVLGKRKAVVFQRNNNTDVHKMKDSTTDESNTKIGSFIFKSIKMNVADNNVMNSNWLTNNSTLNISSTNDNNITSVASLTTDIKTLINENNVTVHAIGNERTKDQLKRDKTYFAMCMIVKNDHLDIVEWIEYHRRLGCSKFYISDHNSTVPMLDTIRQYVSSGLVEYFFSDFSTIERPQLHVYSKCLADHGKHHMFMGFLDSDEFIVVVNKSQSIPDVLRNYEKFGGLTLNWKRFGSSGHVKRPVGGILSNYKNCFKDFRVKTVGNTNYCLQPKGNPHAFIYRDGYFAVDTEYNRIDGPWNLNISLPVPSHVYDIMYINHYNLKSVEDYARKVAKGKADNSAPSNKSLFDSLDAAAKEFCGTLKMPV